MPKVFYFLEYSRDLILPTRNDSEKKDVRVPSVCLKDQRFESLADNVKEVRDDTGHDLEILEEFFCTPADLFRVFTTKEVILKLHFTKFTNYIFYSFTLYQIIYLLASQ